MPQFLPYLLFDGTCAEALRSYEQIFQGRITRLSTVGQSPMASQFPASRAQRIIHGRLNIGACTLMASDWMAADPYPGIRGVFIMLMYPDPESAAHVFEALAVGGHVQSPLQATPFARAYGMLADRFGVPWQVMVE